jgi:hypothetical protein
MFHSLAFRTGLMGESASATGGDAVSSRMSGILGKVCDAKVKVDLSWKRYAPGQSGSSLLEGCEVDMQTPMMPGPVLLIYPCIDMCARCLSSTKLRCEKSLALCDSSQGPAGRSLLKFPVAKDPAARCWSEALGRSWCLLVSTTNHAVSRVIERRQSNTWASDMTELDANSLGRPGGALAMASRRSSFEPLDSPKLSVAEHLRRTCPHHPSSLTDFL